MNTLENIHVRPIITDFIREKWQIRKKQINAERDELWGAICRVIKQTLGDLAPLEFDQYRTPPLEVFTSPIIVTFKPTPLCGPIRARYVLQDSQNYPFKPDFWPVIHRGFCKFAIPRVNTSLDWNERVTWADSMQWYFTNDLDEALGASEETGAEITTMQAQAGFDVEPFPLIETLMKGTK